MARSFAAPLDQAAALANGLFAGIAKMPDRKTAREKDTPYERQRRDGPD
jgi:hypothetical protein